MAYVLGLIFADGAVEDTRRSSRTCYIQLTSKDKQLLCQVKTALSSKHKLRKRKNRLANFRGKSYLCAEVYNLRIGNKVMYGDLLDLGVTPRKSLAMRFPDIPSEFLSFFLRGYFDGDGNLSLHKSVVRNVLRLRLAFTSGSKNFLKTLSGKLALELNMATKNLYKSPYAYYLRYSKKDGLKILSFMYNDLDQSPYLKRKYKIYADFLKNESKSFQP